MIKTFEIGKICEICLSPVTFFLHFSKSLLAENDFGHWSQKKTSYSIGEHSEKTFFVITVKNCLIKNYSTINLSFKNVTYNSQKY